MVFRTHVRDGGDRALPGEGLYVRAYVTANSPEDKQWIRPGWSWPGGRDGARFPTFMKSIRRLYPPPKPAGLDRTGPATRQRWRDDQFRFPPYQYSPNFLVVHPRHPPRVLDGSERELLLGFGAQHILLLAWAHPQWRRAWLHMKIVGRLCVATPSQWPPSPSWVPCSVKSWCRVWALSKWSTAWDWPRVGALTQVFESLWRDFWLIILLFSPTDDPAISCCFHYFGQVPWNYSQPYWVWSKSSNWSTHGS